MALVNNFNYLFSANTIWLLTCKTFTENEDGNYLNFHDFNGNRYMVLVNIVRCLFSEEGNLTTIDQNIDLGLGW